MFVPILIDMFNHWFTQGAIPGSITKGVITLLKEDGKHVWEARVSTFADITVFVSHHLDIEAVKKAVGEYKQIAGAKVSFDKSKGLRLGAWRGSDTLPGPFRWSDGPVRILGGSSGPTSNWSEIGRKYKLR